MTIFVRLDDPLRSGGWPSSFGLMTHFVRDLFCFIPGVVNMRRRRFTLLYSGFTFMSFPSFMHIITPYYILWRTYRYVKERKKSPPPVSLERANTRFAPTIHKPQKINHLTPPFFSIIYYTTGGNWKKVHKKAKKVPGKKTWPPLIKSFCGGSRGAVFSKRVPLAAGGKKAKKLFAKVWGIGLQLGGSFLPKVAGAGYRWRWRNGKHY